MSLAKRSSGSKVPTKTIVSGNIIPSNVVEPESKIPTQTDESESKIPIRSASQIVFSIIEAKSKPRRRISFQTIESKDTIETKDTEILEAESKNVPKATESKSRVPSKTESNMSTKVVKSGKKTASKTHEAARKNHTKSVKKKSKIPVKIIKTGTKNLAKPIVSLRAEIVPSADKIAKPILKQTQSPPTDAAKTNSKTKKVKGKKPVSNKDLIRTPTRTSILRNSDTPPSGEFIKPKMLRFSLPGFLERPEAITSTSSMRSSTSQDVFEDARSRLFRTTSNLIEIYPIASRSDVSEMRTAESLGSFVGLVRSIPSNSKTVMSKSMNFGFQEMDNQIQKILQVKERPGYFSGANDLGTNPKISTALELQGRVQQSVKPGTKR